MPVPAEATPQPGQRFLMLPSASSPLARLILGLIQKRSNVILQYQRKLQKELGGLGKHFETAPSDLKSMKRRGEIRNLSKCAEPV